MLDALESCESFVISHLSLRWYCFFEDSTYELNRVMRCNNYSTYLNFNKPTVFKELLKIPNVDVRITDQAGHARVI